VPRPGPPTEYDGKRAGREIRRHRELIRRNRARLDDLHARLPLADGAALLAFYMDLGRLATEFRVDQGQVLNWLRRWPRICRDMERAQQLGIEAFPLGVGFVVPSRRGADSQPRGRRRSTTLALGQRSEQLIAGGMRPTAADQQTADEANQGRTFPADDLVKPTTIAVYRKRIRDDRKRHDGD
jgi:hypothetical protein